MSTDPSKVLRVGFALGKSDLSPEAKSRLKDELAGLGENSYYRIDLTGYTDVSGSPSANAALSIARAEEVHDFLVDKLKLDPASLAIYGRHAGVTKFGPKSADNRIVELLVFRQVPTMVEQTLGADNQR